MAVHTPPGRPLRLSHSFVMSLRMKSVSPGSKTFLLCCAACVSSVSFSRFFLSSNRLVVEVGEGCRERELSWPSARVRYWVLGADGCYAQHARLSSVYVWVCECACECSLLFSRGNTWQQVWHVVMGNYAAQCKTSSERGHPLSALPSA